MWGCLAKVVVSNPQGVKIGPNTIDCIFIGYAISNNAYSFLVHKSDISNVHVNTIIKSRNASFFENVFLYKDAQERSSLKRTFDIVSNNNQEYQDNENQEATEQEPEVKPRRSKWAKTTKSFGPDFLTSMLENEPQTYKEAVSSLEASFWKEAINAEVESIM